MRILNEVFYLRAEAEKDFPPLDIYERSNEIMVLIDMPGVDPEDILIKIYKDEFILEGVKKQEPNQPGAVYLCMERQFKGFRRKIRLPSEVEPDRATARYQNGVIIVRLPKKEDRVHKIKIIKE